MFSQTAEYALRAAVVLAGGGTSLSTAEIARRTKVPPSYLSKILQHLGKAELITALRGKHGGYQLSRPASQISVLDILNATSPLRRIERCPLGMPACRLHLCPLHQQMDTSIANVERQLSRSWLSELTRPTPDSPGCCPTPDLAAAEVQP